MPKLKTRKAAQKRLRITKSGKVKYFKAGRRHLLVLKRGKKKRQMGKAGYMSDGDRKTMHLLLPYGA